jgi:hypothetical protein
MFPKRVLGHVKLILFFLSHQLLGTYIAGYMYFESCPRTRNMH